MTLQRIYTMPVNFGVMVHGGAGPDKIIKSSKHGQEISKAVENSVSAGYDFLSGGGDAVDAVESAVASMEDSGLFNAGIGSCLTLDKRIEMDASIMAGKDLAAGSVGMVQNIQNPIKLARKVMENTDHVILVSDGAYKLAEVLNFGIGASLIPTEQKLKTYDTLREKLKKTWTKNYELLLPSYLGKSDNNKNDKQRHFGTVGAVAIDRNANVASAVSTGGRWLKMHGRVGDSAIIGAGIYADNGSGAASATGIGELIIRLCLSKYTCDLLKGHNPSQSTKKAIDLLTKRFEPNSGGIIAVDAKKGRFGMSKNTRSMPVALKNSNNKGKTRICFEKCLSAD
jgi:beta-aspartyl-peptidase (threonine type)